MYPLHFEFTCACTCVMLGSIRDSILPLADEIVSWLEPVEDDLRGRGAFPWMPLFYHTRLP